MDSPSEILDMLEFVDNVDLDDEVSFRLRQELVTAAALDEATIEASVGFLAVDRVCFDGRRFDRSIEGIEPEPAVILGVLDCEERLVDILAWPKDRPDRMATLLGRNVMLGEAQARMHSATIFASPLPVFRFAAGWLRHGFVGVVPLDRIESARIFLEVSGAILAEDDAHGAELDDARQELVGRGATIVVAEAA